ncbi:MAG: SRPBCC family protein [Acidobacteria bacterium]|nr:SRPBCC family protein [Acidobacteriota bacterium]
MGKRVVSQVAWELAHSVETEATPAFAWAYLTNVANWNDPPAGCELDGPCAAGSCGTTRMPGQESRRWQIREVSPMQSYTIEASLDRAAMAFEWRFEGLADGRTRLTQRIVLEGENAAAYLEQVQAGFTSSLPAGMNKIAATMARTEARGSGAG